MLSNGEMNLLSGPIVRPDSVLVLANEPPNVDRVWLLSIRHSGTHYMWKPLECLGYERCVVHWEVMAQKNKTGQKQYLHAHLEVGFEYQRSLTTEKCVMPLRNPLEVFKTHCYRYRWELDEYVPYILNAFDRFQHVVDNHDVHIYRVDAEDQELEFSQLAEFLGTTGRYIEQARNVATNRLRDVSMYQGFTENQTELFNNPPKEIFELAKQFGY
jgi:hypothetical protein